MEPLTASLPMIGLLRLLGDGALHTSAGLASRLGLSEPLVAAMIEDLTRHGYLASLPQGCPTACASCGLTQACRIMPPLLVLTPKGRRAAAG